MKTPLILILYILSILMWAQETPLLTLYYDTDQSQLTSKNQIQLDALNLTEDETITVIGYADIRASKNYNIRLSEQRAQNVIHYLQPKHPNIHFILQGKGEIEGDMELARRVEIWQNAPQYQFSNGKVGDSYEFSNITFTPGTHQFQPSAYSILEAITKELKLHSEIHLEIRGHLCCPNPGEEEKEGYDFSTGIWNLSEARAKAVYEYLTSHGIAAERLQYKGMAARFLKPHQSDAANRRVEFILLDSHKGTP